MASFTPGTYFTPGATVSAYRDSRWPQGRADSGTVDATAVASSSGAVTFVGLTGAVRYVAVEALGGDTFRAAAFVPDADPAGGSLYAPVATGVAAVDTANLQALFNLGSAAAPVVIDLPPGQSYQITELVPHSGVTLRGNYSKLVATASSTQGVISNRTLQTPVDRFEVYKVEFVGQGQTVGGGTERRGGVYVYNGSRIVVKDCLAHDFSDHAFGVRNSQDCRIEDNTIWNVCNWFLGNAIEFSAGLASHSTAPQPATRGVIRGNVVVNCRTAPVCVQVTAHQSEQTSTDPAAISAVPAPVKDYDVVVADNPYLEAMTEDVANHGFSAIALEIARYGTPGDTSQGNKMKAVHVHHNHCYMRGTSGSTGPTTWGISVSDNNGSNGPQSTDFDEFSDITVDHNTIESVDGGILCQASRAMIDHNTVRADKRGIMVAFNNAAGHLPEQVMVDGNIVYLDGTKAIYPGVYSFTTAHTTIQNNRITFSGATANGQTPLADGIYANASTSVRIVNNTIRGATRHGINMLSVTDYAIEGNSVINPSSGATNTYHGLLLTSCTGDGVRKGVIARNELLDLRGGSAMMAQSLSFSGGSPRGYVVFNRMLGWNTFAASATTGNVYWWQDNDIGGNVGPFNNVTITPSGSPYTYTNSASGTNPYRQKVIVKGGTVSLVQVKHGSGSAVDTGVVAGEFLLGMGDAIVVTYTVAPTMTAILF